MDKELRLAELLATRLCHDLTGPIGAVNNGAEFLSDDSFSMKDQAMELIIGSAQQAVTRLQFYRQAYGKVNYAGEASLDEVRSLARAFFKETRVELNWPDAYTDAAGVSVSRKMAKVVLNMLILVSGSLPRGGKISVVVTQADGQAKVSVTGEGEGVKLDQEIMAALSGKLDIEDLTPKSVQPYFTILLGQRIGVSISHEMTDRYFVMNAAHI